MTAPPSAPLDGTAVSRTRPDSVRGRALRARALREECRRWGATQGSARIGPAFLRIGPPGVDGLEVDHDWDAALIADLLTDLLDRCSPTALARIVRSGAPYPSPEDRLWESGMRTAAARLGREPRLYVLTRRSWWELISDEHRVWTRLRAP